MGGGQHVALCIPELHSFIIISWRQQGWPDLYRVVSWQMTPIKRIKPTTIKNQETKAKNLPSSSFLVFASNKAPARIASNETGNKCILSGIKTDYSFNGFRPPRHLGISLNKIHKQEQIYIKISFLVRFQRWTLFWRVQSVQAIYPGIHQRFQNRHCWRYWLWDYD